MTVRQVHQIPPRWLQVLLSTLVISSLLLGCGSPFRREAVPEDIPAAEEAISPQPTRTPQPLRDLPPALVEVDPLPDSVISLQQPITLYFNQPMDTVSVEAAVHFEPRVNGRFSWEAEHILTFTPDQALVPGSRLHLAVNTRAQAANRQSLQEAVELDFRVAESLKVLQTIPADGTDVDPESVVFVVFNQPVAALGGDSEQEAAFSLEPEVTGEGEWLNTSTYVFTPDVSLDGGAPYSIILNESLTAVSGAQLAVDQQTRFEFTTTAPFIMSVLPSEGDLLSLDGPIEVQFNIRMDPERVETHFSLNRPSGGRVLGEYSWDESGKQVIFTPERLLTRNMRYTIRLGADASSIGGMSIGEDYETSRTTYPVFNAEGLTGSQIETYHGQYGQFPIRFTAPLDRETYQAHVSITPPVSLMSTFLADDDRTLILSGFFEPETTFTVTIDAGLSDRWGQELGEVLTYTFDSPPAEPTLFAAAGAGMHDLVFVPASESELVVQGTNLTTLTTELAPITVDDLMTLLHPENFDYRQLFLPEDIEVVTRSLSLARNVNEIIRVPLTYEGESLTPGIYYLRITSPDLEDRWGWNERKLFVVVSENNLALKMAPDQSLVWATRLADRAALVNAPVSVYTTEGEQIAEGRTDAQGIFTADFERFEDPFTSFYAIAGETGQQDFAFSISSWGQGYGFQRTGILLNTLPAVKDAYIYTDRPIYRPGDTVHFRAVVFSRENGLPVLLEQRGVQVNIFGDPGIAGIPVKLYSEVHETNPFSAISGTLELPESASPGMYRIEVLSKDQLISDLYFDVAAYRKPEIEVDVTLSPSILQAGESLTAAVQANYYFGLPAGDVPLTWALYVQQDRFDLSGYQVGPLDRDWLMPPMIGFPSPGRLIASGEGKTDAQGQIEVAFSGADLELDEMPAGSLLQYRLEATLVDETGFAVSYRGLAQVHPESFYIGVQPEAYFGRVDSPFEFTILTVDWDRQAAGQTALDVSFDSVRWNLEETLNPEMPYRYVPETERIAGASPITDAEGKARVAFTPEEPGTYQLTVRSGNAVTQVVVWVAGTGSAAWPMMADNQLTLTPDADSYLPGQTARVFVPNPFAGSARALVTLERGRVMNKQVVEITGTGEMLLLPIPADGIPNVYLSVLLLGSDERGLPGFQQGTLNLPVLPAAQTLNVDVQVEPERTEPGETVAMKITVTDQAGNPVQGEFSVAVVDKAVLALVEPNSPPIVDALYGEQPLSVQTSTSLTTYAIQLALRAMDGGLGGGSDQLRRPDVREEFPDTAFWRSDIVTGADGTALLEIPMPDTLTTWVVDVRGLSEDYLVGQAEAEILTQKQLMIRPVTPRFLVDGDQVELGAVVHNNTPGDVDVRVALQGTGIQLQDDQARDQTVRIPAGGRERVNWWVTVESVDSASLVFLAETDTLQDASAPVWGDLPVLRYQTPITFSTSGQLAEEGQRMELVSLPQTADPRSGELAFELSPSLTSSLAAGLTAMDSLPYEDTVSTLSHLMANLHVHLALTRLEIEPGQPEEDPLKELAEQVNRLLETQNFDGGWSWWRRLPGYAPPASDPFITAYVVLGLTQADEAGLPVSEHLLDRAMTYLSENLADPELADQGRGLDLLATQVYALRDTGMIPVGILDGLFARRSVLSPWGVGLLAMTLKEQDGAATRVNTLLSDLEAQAVRSAAGVYWQGEGIERHLPGSLNFNTAVAVFALARLDPASTSVTPAVRYLMAQRDGAGLWSSAFDSAWALMAITEALQGTGDYQSDFEYRASLNRSVIAEGEPAGPAALDSIQVTLPMEALHAEAPNALVIEREAGAGTLYYRTDLRTFHPASEAGPVNRGISLERDYYLSGEGCPGEADCQPIRRIELDPQRPFQAVTVVITVNIPHDMTQVMIEDSIPAGSEVLNLRLLTSPQMTEEPDGSYHPRRPFDRGWGWWHFSSPQIYDDHLLWTADFIPAGTYTLTYELLPFQRGTYQVLPARAWQFYFPDVQGASAGDRFTIE